jgi:hypothetical protein
MDIHLMAGTYKPWTIDDVVKLTRARNVIKVVKTSLQSHCSKTRGLGDITIESLGDWVGKEGRGYFLSLKVNQVPPIEDDLKRRVKDIFHNFLFIYPGEELDDCDWVQNFPEETLKTSQIVSMVVWKKSYEDHSL